MNYTLNITSRCNLRCTYCCESYRGDADYKVFEMDLDEVDRQIAQILENGDCDLLFLLGGEIFLSPDTVLAILGKYHQYFRFDMQTNGTIRNNFWDNLIAKYKPLLGVSLDDPQSVRRQRIGLNFDKALANAKYWNTLTKVCISATINPLNIHRIKETFDFYVLEHGFDHIHFNCVKEWMNDYYWSIYKAEVERLLWSTDLAILSRISLSPWQDWQATHKVAYDPNFVLRKSMPLEVISPLHEAKYFGYKVYCARLGKVPKPLHFVGQV